MEHKQSTSDNFNHSPYSNQAFLADRFAKKSNNLNIPDTILENCTAELNEDSSKVEVPKVAAENFSSEDKENVCINLQVKSNESINSSTNISIDNSYIRQCERKLLESSNGEDDKSIESDKCIVNTRFVDAQRKLIYHNDTISTPPSLLRKEISLLRSEMTEADEFHDLEIQVLKEEKLNEADSYNYLELFEKYSTLMELYTTVKAEYDDYRKEQEKIRQEYQSKTADCLEFLCSQIEASDNSLNFSNASFLSFNGGIKCSTMMEDVSEIEATVVHDATILANDPLSITNDVVFKTPMQTPLKSSKKFEEEMNSAVTKPIVKKVKNILTEHETAKPLDSEYNIQLLNLETALYDKVKEVEDLEQRLFRIEDLSSVLQNEFERITSVYAKENNILKENLAKKTEQLNELTQKLFMEIISLNPSLRDSLNDISEMKLLIIFIETIMESCKKIQNEEITKHNVEKTDWEALRKSELMTIKDLQNQTSLQLTELENLKKVIEGLEIKLHDAENIILNRDGQIQMLQSHVSILRETQEDFPSLKETLSELESRLILIEAEKRAAENRNRELEAVVENLRHEIEMNGELRLQLQTQLLTAEERKSEIESDNVRLRQLYDTLKDQMAEVENTLKSNEFEVMVFKENLASADETILQLRSKLQYFEVEKMDLENRFSELQENNKHLLVEINSTKNLENISANEKILNENDNLKQIILEKEKILTELQTELELAKERQMSSLRRVEELTKEMEDLKNENSAFSKTLDALEESQKNLADLLSNIKNDSDSSSDKIIKLIENSSKLQESTETRETKIISVFKENLMKACKDVQNDMIKLYDNKKLECETQRSADLNLITSLQDQIQCLTEKCIKQETKISEINIEKEGITELLEILKTKMSEAEKTISTCNEQIKMLKSQENILKHDIAAADGTITELKSQMLSILTEKSEVENQCKKLEENVLNFQNEIEMKQTITKELGDMKIILEKIEIENRDLKQQIFKSDEMIVLLKKNVEEAKEEQNKKEVRMQNLQKENELLQNEQESLVSLSKKLEILEKNNKNLMDILSDIQYHLDMPESTIAELLSNNFENKKMFSEKLNLIKTQMENQFQWQETKQMEFDDLKKKYEVSNKKLSDSENIILARDEEIRTIQCDMRQIQEDFTAAKKYILDLKSQLNLCESEKSEIEIRCHALEEIIESLKREIDANEKLRMDLQTNLSSAEEKKSEFENENVRLRELCDVLRVKTTEAEETISKLDDEIQILKLNQNSQLELEELRKMYETLRIKFLDTQRMSLSRVEEIRILQVEILNMRQTQEGLAASQEVLSDKLKFTETEQRKVENRCCELENTIENLKQEIKIKENFLTELETQKSEVKMENVKLKESYDTLKVQMIETENTREEEIRLLKSYKSELIMVKENLVSADETISQLKFQLKSIEVEKSEVENRCSELQKSNQNLRVEITTAKNLESNPVYEKIQIENNDLKQRIFESDKMMTELKNELELAKKDQMSNICKVEELIREIEELKKENTDFSHAFTTIEETQKNLADVLLDVEHDNDLTSDRIIKLITQNSKLPNSETKQNKILTDFVETITKTCKGVQNDLIKKFDNKILEWESQKDVDLQNFQDQIRLLTERNTQYEASIKQTKNSLAVADDTILQLKSQLSVIKTEKTELEIERQKLKEKNLILHTEIDTKETIIKGLDELKVAWKKIEIENDDLKQQTLESEEIVVRLKNCLEVKKEEQNRNEIKIQSLQNEVDLLRKEQEDLIVLSGKLESIEKNNKNLLNILLDIQSYLDMPEDTLTKLMSGNIENKKIFSEKIDSFAKTQMEELKEENKHLKFGIDNLKQKVKQLTELISETANNDLKETFSNLNSSHSYSMSLRSKSKNTDICKRRLDKLEEINHNLTEMLTRILSITGFPDLEKLKLCSAKDFSNIMKKLVAHFKELESKMKELREENAQLDEECETYSNIIKDLKKEAAVVWKSNKEKTEAMESKISLLNEEKNCLENEKQDLLAKISKFESENQKLKSTSKTEEPFHTCTCGNESKKINELKRAILVKEQKLLELQDLELQISSYKSQIEYLKTALEREKKKVGEEKEKNKKLQNELNESTKNQKTENKKADDNQILDELRMRGTVSGGIVQEFVDKEKMRKLSKDIGILKELCRARYAEIKRLEAMNAALRNGTPKNSNQMDSPLRSRGYNTRSKNQIRDLWRTEISGKENDAL